jgi:protocatechuate 3,4-dioxygenase alpha subunit
MNMANKLTPSQTIGPFFHEAWRWAAEATSGISTGPGGVTVSGVIRDGDGNPINDAVIEAWLPDGAASEAGQMLAGFRRVYSDDDGGFRLEIVPPAASNAGKPAMFVTVFARGLVKHQFTAVFLEDDTGLDKSELLNQVPSERRQTLIASKHAGGQYRWDIWMQTEKETVFFDYV